MAGFLLGSYWQTVSKMQNHPHLFLKEWRQRCAYRSLHSFKIDDNSFQYRFAISDHHQRWTLSVRLAPKWWFILSKNGINKLVSVPLWVLQPCRQASTVSSAFNTATQIHWANVQAQGLQWVCSLCWPVVCRGRFILEKQHTQPHSDLDFVVTGVFQKENNIWINHMQLSVFPSGDKAGGKNRPNLLL